jgi:hypothetical protein
VTDPIESGYFSDESSTIGVWGGSAGITVDIGDTGHDRAVRTAAVFIPDPDGHGRLAKKGRTDPFLSVYQIMLKIGGIDPKPGVYYSPQSPPFLRSLSNPAFDMPSDKGRRATRV